MTDDTKLFVKVLIASGHGVKVALERALAAAEKWLKAHDEHGKAA